MNFGVVFCAVGVGFWVMQVVYKVTVCAEEKGKIPNAVEFREWTIQARDRRNARALLVGGTFFFLFGVFGWVISSGNPKVMLQPGQLVYAAARLALPFLFYVNASLRFLVYRFSANYVKSKGATELRESFRYTGVSPDGDDVASKMVRRTNYLIVITVIVLFFAALFLS
jgi:hypothetical protein